MSGFTRSRAACAALLLTCSWGAALSAAGTSTVKPAAAPAKQTPAAAGQAAFDWAFRLASAIASDANDRSMAEELAVLDMGLYGALDEAIRRADEVDGWRRGVAYAELAKMLIAGGRIEDAKALLDKARGVRVATQGWQGPRIDAHVAQAAALLGDEAAGAALTRVFDPNDRQYFGRPAATRAAALAAKGDFDGAMALLRPLDGSQDEDVAWWRTAGYVDVAQATPLAPAQRAVALAAARTSAAGIPGWRRAEALGRVAKACAEMKQTGPLRAVLEEAETIALGLDPDVATLRAPLLAETARGWARAGDAERAARLLAEAEATAPRALPTERPALFADVANGWHAAGEADRARDAWETAFRITEGLVNARPRALAAVEIARAYGRAGIALDEATLRRFATLLAGLKAPW